MTELPPTLPLKRPIGERIVSGPVLDAVAELRATLDPPQSAVGVTDVPDPGWERDAGPRPEDGPQTGLGNPPDGPAGGE